MIRLNHSLFIFIVLLSSTIYTYAQHPRERVWVVGSRSTINQGYTNVIIDFSKPETTFTVPEVEGVFSIDRTNASICNDEGRLILYTNSLMVSDSFHRVIPNGDTLSNTFSYFNHRTIGFGYPQAATLLPWPHRADEYMLIYGHHDLWPAETIDESLHPKLFFAHIAKGNDGYYVISKENLIMDEIQSLYNYAIQHNNGEDWWVISNRFLSNEYNLFLLDSSGIILYSKQVIGKLPEDPGNGHGITLSPNGKTIAKFIPLDGLELIDIDRSTGELSNYRHMEIPNLVWPQQGSVAFSPSGRFLYFCDATQLYQVDMEAEDWRASTVLIDTFDGYLHENFWPTAFRDMRRTPDCRIFIAAGGNSIYLHVIHEPEKPGKDCRFEQRAITLPDWQYGGLPNHPLYVLDTEYANYCDSLISTTTQTLDPPHDHLQVWPNPTTSTLSFSWEETGRWSQAEIYDMNGKLIHSKVITGTHQSSFWLQDLPTGVYMLRLTDTNGHQIHRKVLKK